MQAPLPRRTAFRATTTGGPITLRGRGCSQLDEDDKGSKTEDAGSRDPSHGALPMRLPRFDGRG